MKKTLHGKRHIRARATVQIGRQKKRYRKMSQEIKAIIMFIEAMPLLVTNATKALQFISDRIVDLANSTGPFLVKLLEKMNNELSKTKSPS